MRTKLSFGNVAVRIQSLKDKEAGEGCWAVLELVDGEPQVFTQNTIQFFRSPLTMPSFLTFPMRSSMRDREEDCQAVIHLVQCGQTGSGKTHSRGTAYSASDDPALHSEWHKQVCPGYIQMRCDINRYYYPGRAIWVVKRFYILDPRCPHITCRK